jgi:hypothetical protein
MNPTRIFIVTRIDKGYEGTSNVFFKEQDYVEGGVTMELQNTRDKFTEGETYYLTSTQEDDGK